MTRWEMARRALRLSNINSSEKIVLIQLCAVASTSATSKLPQARIAEYSKLSLRTVARCLADLDDSGYIERTRSFHKLSGYRLTDKIKLSFAKPSFSEPSKKQRLHAKLAPWPHANLAPHYIYREEPNPAEAFSVIKGGKL